MLAEIKRFHTLARRVLDEPVGGEAADEPLGEFVRRSRLSGYFRDNFLLPLVAAVWSCDEATAERYPARYLFTFLDHHGMLSVYGSPSWRTVTGGSATYVQAVADHVEGRGGRFLFATPVTGVRETGGGVTVTAGGTETAFDAVVIATHPHHALTMLESPTTAQQEVLGAIGYAPKPAVLHTDESLLPRAARARASWNYQIRDDRYEGRSETDPAAVAVTYDMTRLMRLPTGTAASGDSQGPGRARPMPPRYLVTMGRVDLVDPDTVLASMTYEHPVYDTASVAAQRRLPSIDTGVVAFAGALNRAGLAARVEHLRSTFDRAAILLIDLDDFKSINDTAGHLAGDAALLSLTRIALSHLRAEDSLERFGGDEFCVVMPGITLDTATELAETIRRDISDPQRSGNSVPFTVSIGVAEAPLNHSSAFERVLSLADVALYVAKRSGRNAVREACVGSGLT